MDIILSCLTVCLFFMYTCIISHTEFNSIASIYGYYFRIPWPDVPHSQVLAILSYEYCLGNMRKLKYIYRKFVIRSSSSSIYLFNFKHLFVSVEIAMVLFKNLWKNRIMPPLPEGGGQMHYVFGLYIRASIHLSLYSCEHDISIVSWWIFIKLDMVIHREW